MWTAKILFGTWRKSTHASTAQMALSMCSSRYCSTFVPLFFLYFWAIVVFWDSFIFLIFFLHLGAQKKSHRKYELKQVKGMACGNFIRRAQNWQKTCDHEKRIFWPVFGQNKFLLTQLFHFCSSLFCLLIFFWDSLTFSFYFFDIFSSLRSTKEVTTK